MYPVALPYIKGLGDAALYALAVYGVGYWDFALLGEVAEVTPGCKQYLAEVPGADPGESWYYADISLPSGGPYPIDIFLESTGGRVGRDLATGTGATGGSGGAPDYPEAVTPITGRYVTRGQFAVKVLQTLGIYDGTAADSVDQQNVLDAYDAVYLELLDDGLVTWVQAGENEQIPLRFLLSLVSMVAATDVLLATYPQTAQNVTLLKAAAASADRKIRRQLASAQPTETVTAEFF